MSKSPYHVLVADDEALLSNLVKTVLTQDGHTVEVCADGEEALKTFDPTRHTLIIMDIMMPRKTGVEVLRELRARNVRVPAILMSSLLTEDVRKICEGLDRLVFLQKPFSVSELRAALAKINGGVRC